MGRTSTLLGFCDYSTLKHIIIYYMFSTRQICSRERRKKQFDWVATNTDNITTQSHTLFASMFVRKELPSGKRA